MQQISEYSRTRRPLGTAPIPGCEDQGTPSRSLRPPGHCKTGSAFNYYEVLWDKCAETWRVNVDSYFRVFSVPHTCKEDAMTATQRGGGKHTYTCTGTCILSIDANLCICMFVYLYLFISLSLSLSLDLCMYVSIYLHTHTSTQTHTYTHTNPHPHTHKHTHPPTHKDTHTQANRPY